MKELNFICKICGKRYVSSTRLTTHSRVHSLEKPYICHICPKAYHYKQKLKNHITSHTGEKNYKCSYCDRCFRCYEVSNYEKKPNQCF